MIQKMILHSNSPEDTEKIGEDIGKNLVGGEIIELASDLGGGKTTFTRGLVRGAGSEDHVASPTFTISKVYKSDKFDIYHYDFYRLNDAGLLEHDLSDLIGDPKSVLIVEWGNVIEHVLSEDRLRIEILQQDNDCRELHIFYPDNLKYLMDA